MAVPGQDMRPYQMREVDSWRPSMVGAISGGDGDAVLLAQTSALHEKVPSGGAATFCPRNLGCVDTELFLSCLQGTVPYSFKEVYRWQKESPAAAGAAEEA